MSKRYKGKTCVYCATEGASNTGDHVFAREFFPAGKRDGLPVVPACETCNNAKSALEHYLTAVLPFAGRHVDSSTMLNEAVPRRLAKNQKLHRELGAGTTSVTVEENGKRCESIAIPMDSDRLTRLFAYIARGLAAHHWDVVIPPGHQVEAVVLNPFFEPLFRELFLKRARNRVDGSIGDGAFLYEGAQAVDDPALTLWRFQIFGGLVMVGDAHVPEPGAHTVWVTTARNFPGFE